MWRLLLPVRCHGQRHRASLLLRASRAYVHSARAFLLHSSAAWHVEMERRLICILTLLQQKVLLLPNPDQEPVEIHDFVFVGFGQALSQRCLPPQRKATASHETRRPPISGAKMLSWDAFLSGSYACLVM